MSMSVLIHCVYEFVFEVVFEPHGGVVSHLFRPEIVSGRSKLTRPEIYTYSLAA